MTIKQMAAVPTVESGATWRRVDFHLHTPGVASFVCSDGADLRSDEGRRAVVKTYVGRLAEAGISLCAITDYNGVRERWFDLIRDDARTRGITVLPGAELSFNYGGKGLHLLVVFGAQANPAAINSAILGMDQNPSKPLLGNERKHRDIDLREPLSVAIENLRRQLPCIVIPPHPDQSNGLCKSLQAKQAAQELKDMKVDAIEHCPNAELDRLVSTGVLDSSFLSRVAQVEFTDPKRIEDIGNKRRTDGTLRATWLKLSSVDLSAIRLALHDPATRVCVGDVPELRHTRIEHMEVNGSGFLGKTVVAWNPDLNVIIGGRGTGKSAIIETLRYALGVPPYSEASYREGLVRHSLGSGGKVTLVVERPVSDTRRRYRVERVLGEEPRVYEEGAKAYLDVTPTDLFGPGVAPAIFGQREIYGVSASEEYRLRLLDDLIGEEARTRGAAVRDAAEGLRENARRILDAARKLSKRDELLQRLKTIEHELSIYEKEGVAEKLRSATNLRTDGQHLRGASEAVAAVRRTSAEALAEIESTLNRASDRLKQGKSSERAILDEAAAAITELARELTRLGKEASRVIENTAGTLQQLEGQWRLTVKPLEEELNRIKQQLHTEALDPDRLLTLTEEKTALGPLLEDLDRLDRQRRDMLTRRRQMLDDLKRRRLEEHQLRRERAEAIGAQLRGRLRLRVDFKAQKQDYRARLSSILKGSGVTADAQEKLVAPEATDGMALAEAVRTGSAEVESRFGLTIGMAQRLVQWLTAEEERIFELETLMPPDAVQVELKVDEAFRPLDRLSGGQRATAILLLLFALRGRILVLDQPDEDLDNRFVYEDIVTILREQKGLTPDQDRRQIVAATHNANIPVLGDAEQVVALEVEDGRARVVSRASIDDPPTRALIKRVMEGGDEAFSRRAEKYGEA
ncbi:MAG: TrlF family AAA-like ATPase [Acidobacteriota bacterium]